MKILTVPEAQGQLTRLIAEVNEGEPIEIEYELARLFRSMEAGANVEHVWRPINTPVAPQASVNPAADEFLIPRANWPRAA